MGSSPVPLTEYQMGLARLLSTNRTPDSYLAGGAALHLEPNSRRYSNDLDYFHDSVERVAGAYREDAALLVASAYVVELDMQQPGYIRALVRRKGEATKVEWAHDSAWRFLPTVYDERCGFRLHPVDLAVNKVLALVGRDEARDFVDVLDLHENLLPLGALLWAAAGKDPGFTPLSLLDLLRRRGKVRPEEMARLHLARPADLPALKRAWLEALDAAVQFIHSRPASEVGCLYYAPSVARFVVPGDGAPPDTLPHFGRPGGVLPRVIAGA